MNGEGELMRAFIVGCGLVAHRRLFEIRRGKLLFALFKGRIIIRPYISYVVVSGGLTWPFYKINIK